MSSRTPYKLKLTWFVELSSTLKSTPSYNLLVYMYTFYHLFDSRKIIDGVICRKWEKIQEKVITAAHDPPASGHLGVDKTLDRIRTAYYFPKMTIKVKLHLGKYLVCHKKSRNQKKIKSSAYSIFRNSPRRDSFMDFMEKIACC